MLKNMEVLSVEGTYIEMILDLLGLSEQDMLEDPFYLKELKIRSYPIDTLVNLLMRKNLLLVQDGVDDYRILRNYGSTDIRTQLQALADYHELLVRRWNRTPIRRDAIVAQKVGTLLN